MNRSLVIAAGWAKRRLLSVHPARIRFQRFLRGLPLDPDQLPSHVEDLERQDFIICGCPRTGTSLLTAMLFQPPAILTVNEPWDGMRMPPRALFDSLRQELRGGRLTRGTMDLNALLSDGRVRRVPEGTTSIDISADNVFSLGVKWPGYYRLIERMPQTKFLVCLRHPLEVIASFKTIGGSVAEGLDYDTLFNREMNETLRSMTADVVRRRIYLFDYVHSRILPVLGRPNVLAVRYDRWATQPVAQRNEIAQFLGTTVTAGPIQLRPESKVAALSLSEAELIRRECRTAEGLGYSLAPPL